jgi:subtilisin family serine protease
MTRRVWLLAAIFLAFAVPAKADSRIIVRTTLGLQGLQQVLQPLCLLPTTCTVVNGLGDPLNQLFVVTTSLNPTTLLDLIRGLPGVVDAEIDQLLSLVGGLNQVTTPPAALSDSTPLAYYKSTVWNGYANQPAAQLVHASSAQSLFHVSGSGTVADIDTGIDPNHPAFAGVLKQGYDFTRNQPGASELNDLSPTDFSSLPTPCAPSTCPPAQVNQSSAAFLDQSSAAFLDTHPRYAAFGHGTMVMGVIHLVAPTAFLLPLKAFNSDGTGYLSDILRAIYYAVGNGANAINMSFDFPASSPELESALNYASQSALICAASSGNDGQKADPSTPSGMVYPAALQNLVMGVASTTATDPPTRSSFSNYGNAIVWVAAPGEGIVTTYPFSTYSAGWGTSFSAPFVSGAAALLLNKQATINESQAAAAVANAVPMPGADMGNGRLDLVQALQALSPQDFTMSVAPATSTINAGESATYALTITPSGGFNQSVALSCGGFPPASTCTITPPIVALDGSSPVTATVVVKTTARSAVPPRLSPRVPPMSPVAVALAYLLVWMACLFHFAARRFGRSPFQRPGLSAAVGLLAILLYSYSCGGTANPGDKSSSQASPISFSLTLNPTSVNGGNTSTGAILLSSPAPSSGAVLALSSSNTSVATVPASLSVTAGSKEAAFSVSTKPSANSTTVTISASSSGVTQTAPLTVTPQPPSGPTLTSLGFNPNPVGGASSSTGTVMLSGPAPSGGALVSLSSNNPTVVSVQSSVTVPSGETETSFRANTGIVTTSTPVTISASYDGVTQTSSVTVTPPPPPGTPTGTYSLTITGTSGNLSHNTVAGLTVN